jgi:hypothetical protein
VAKERTRAVFLSVAMLAIGYVLGTKSPRPTSVPEAPSPSAPGPGAASSAAPVETESVATILAGIAREASSSGTAPVASHDPAYVRERLERARSLEKELETLASSLARPQDYRSVSAVLDDLGAWDAARARRDAVARELAGDVPPLEPVPELSPGLRERARLIERAGALGLTVRGVPQDVHYLPVAAPSPGASEPTRFQGVALGSDSAGPRIIYRTARGDSERCVELTEDAARRRDVVRVSYSDRDGPVRLVRTSELGPAGGAWRWFAERLWTRGYVEHDELEQLVARPLAHAPHPGWIDWLRRHLDLPRNRDLGEEYGPPPALGRLNPLLLIDPKARPAYLERPDLVVDPERRDPPIALAGRGPFVLVAANAVAVYDNAWRWIVFDPARRRAVDHAELAAASDSDAAVEHLEWEFRPEPERFPQTREGDLVDALQSTALERTRQAMSLITLPGEVTDLGAELRRKVGGALTRDGLDALQLRDQILDRMRKLDALGHLLLDDDGSSYYERAHDRAKIETMVEVVDLIVRMIEDGRDGPAEYLMRDERVKTLLFHPPAGRSERDRLRKLFRQKFRPWSVRVSRMLDGLPTQWYEEDGG